MRKIHPVWGTLTLLLALAGLALCVLGLRVGTLAVVSRETPEEAVAGFFRELSAGDYESAYERLANYRSLGLENQPRTADGALLLEALRESWEYTPVGEAERSGADAVETIRLRSLSLAAVEAALQGDGAPTLEELLSRPEAVYVRQDYCVALTYDGQHWLIRLEDDLLRALQGAAGEVQP